MSVEQRKWSQEETYHLISFYRELRVLWDPSNRDYGVKSKRAEAISALAEKFCTNDAEINRKIHNLRCQFRGEVRNYNRRIKNDLQQNNGLSSVTISVSSWQFFDVMKDVMGYGSDREIQYESEEYLDPSPERIPRSHSMMFDPLSSIYNMDVTSSTRMLPTHNDSPEKYLQNTPTSKRRKVQPSTNQPTASTAPQDDIQLFGTHVANELRYLSKENQRIAKLRITRILLDLAEMEGTSHEHRT